MQKIIFSNIKWLFLIAPTSPHPRCPPLTPPRRQERSQPPRHRGSPSVHFRNRSCKNIHIKLRVRISTRGMVQKFAINAVKRSIGSTAGCTITEKAPTRAFSWLKAPTSAFTFKTLLRHYAKRALTRRRP